MTKQPNKEERKREKERKRRTDSERERERNKHPLTTVEKHSLGEGAGRERQTARQFIAANGNYAKSLSALY